MSKQLEHLAVTLLVLVPIAMINGFVLMKMWSWFIVSTFNAQDLRLVQLKLEYFNCNDVPYLTWLNDEINAVYYLLKKHYT